MTEPMCIYHGNCADGFGAAWAMRKAYPDAEFHPGVYQTDPPDVTDRLVYLLDFSYKRPVMERMLEVAEKIVVLDHHKSAEADLLPLMDPERPRHILGKFDLEKSGAMLAWEWFHTTEDPPQLIRHIQDRDLWKFDIEGTREIQAAVFSYPYDFEVWDELMARPPHLLYAEGVAIERKHHKDVAELVGVCQRRMAIGGHDVPVASLPYTLVSDAAHMMAKGEPFAACYWDTAEGRVFGLRSAEDGIDVSEVAAQYGGGGHKHAAGFRVTLAEAVTMEDT